SNEFTVGEHNQLVVEIAKSHMAFIGSKENGKIIVAYELFTFNEEEATDFAKLFAYIKNDSKILDKKYLSSQVYLNHEFCVPIPIFRFNKEISSEYLNVIFGEDLISQIHFEHLPVEPGIMNAFRVNKDCFNLLHTHLSKVTFHHTYSNIIRRVLQRTFVYPSQFVSIQFYNTFMVVIVLKDGMFQLIQNFTYETPADVLYYLLNITEQLEMFSESLTLQISGMIDLDFQLYRELIKYFKHVTVQDVEQSRVALDTNNHPLHYFTPFFNLAL
ncbi:MAG: DUF3822 family protein, partial [Bacteroidota bacterium]|nr:DUF3822 family protein [Bacteroidota bacterium]